MRWMLQWGWLSSVNRSTKPGGGWVGRVIWSLDHWAAKKWINKNLLQQQRWQHRRRQRGGVHWRPDNEPRLSAAASTLINHASSVKFIFNRNHNSFHCDSAPWRWSRAAWGSATAGRFDGASGSATWPPSSLPPVSFIGCGWIIPNVQ